MTERTLIQRSLVYYWRTHAAVCLGVATAVAVLAGALVVGDSVRGSLRDLVVQRLGRTENLVTGATWFRERLASDLAVSSCPLIALEGVVTHDTSGSRAGRVLVYGVDRRFFDFHGVAADAPSGRDVWVTEALASEIQAKSGDALQVRIEAVSAIPSESLHGRKDDPGRTLRVGVGRIAGASQMGQFSLRPQQGSVRAVFIALDRLQRDLQQRGKVNTILTAAAPDLTSRLNRSATLQDLGLRVKELDGERGLSVESGAMVLSDVLVRKIQAAAQAVNASSQPVLTYLVNTLRNGEREVPYSLVTALDSDSSGLALNQWAAAELKAKPGDAITLEYFVWQPSGALKTESKQLAVQRILPMQGLAVDRELAPEYPGISDTDSLSDWDPPFPMDLKRIRPADEAYWDRYRTAPKAFISLAEGQRLWGSRFGQVTSVRVTGGERSSFEASLRKVVQPADSGLVVVPLRQQSLQASAGATDFGAYFTYFSFFLVIAALLLAGLFFRFGVEQRLQQIGMLRAVGYSVGAIRKLLLTEAMAVAVAGTLLGLVASLAYGALLLLGLRTIWVDAVGTRQITLHASPLSLMLGAAGGLLMAPVFIVGAMRRLRDVTPRSLLGSVLPVDTRRPYVIGGLLAIVALALAGAGWAGAIGGAGAFFGAGSLLLAGSLFLLRGWLGRRETAPLQRVPQLGFRYAAYRPGRSVLCIALIASAAFVIVSVDSFRQGGGDRAGTGGYAVVAESALPLYYDPNTEAGRQNLFLPSSAEAAPKWTSFRLKPGEDASCLNLYQPTSPRVLGVPNALVRQNRFRFAESMAQTERERQNPWTLLDGPAIDGAIPAIGDANSLAYVLHRKVGDVFEMRNDHGGFVRLRIVASLKNSIFQSELLVGEKNFLQAFPDQEGFRFFLLDVPPERIDSDTAYIERALADYGFDGQRTSERLASYHRVENTYLSTFQALGGLGLILGTIGLGAVLLRNVLERRKEIALLRAVGYREPDLARLMMAENAFLVLAGLLCGTLSAMVAVAPAWAERGGGVPYLSLAALLGAVLLTGLVSTGVAVRAAMREPLLGALRSE